MNKITKSLMLVASIALVQLPVSEVAQAAEAKAEKKKRKTQLVGASVGKKVSKAFELYSADDIKGALELLLEIETKKEYDRAYVDMFLARLYATTGDEANAIKFLKTAIAPDILNEKDQDDSMKLLGDLQMQTKAYEQAIQSYNDWMAFSGKSDGDTWVKIASANYELKRLDKMIEPADKAIAAYGDKHNKNPYVLKLQSYFERKKYRESIQVLETVLPLFPEEPIFWNQLGNFYLMVEDYDRGLAMLSLAYKQGFLTKESQLKTLASLYSQQNVPYKGAKLLQKHIDNGDIARDEKSLASLANAYHAAMNIDMAAKYYAELAKLTGEAKHYSKTGVLLAQDEQFKKAVVALDKAISLNAKNKGRLYMAMAESYYYLGEYKKAHDSIQSAMKDPKTRKTARAWVGYIKDKAKRKGKPIS